jgi:EAL domain-containing protein (putative c-di-GMP-specific phosphodiesterase class I)
MMSGQPRVLIVDDEPAIIRAMRRMLTNVGFEVTSAVSEPEARELLDAAAFDAIVSDIHIGEGSGVELLRRVRQRDADMPVIMITGAPEVDTAIRAVEYGAFRYLVKPVCSNELERVIAEAISARRTAVAKRAAIVHYESELEARRTLEANFSRALDTLFLAYQPIVRWSDRSVRSYEALLRTGDRSLPHPGAVLSAAEKLGGLRTLGQKIRRIAADEMRLNPAQSLFVNLHASDLADEQLYDRTAPLSAIADRVVLEITERFALHDVDNLRARISDLRAMGFKIAIDDLGEGYAGLTSLLVIEPELIKLDMSIVRGVERSQVNQRLVRTMVAFSKESGAALIAEGVETVAERDALVDLGCDLFQGYLFARPAPNFPGPVW